MIPAKNKGGLLGPRFILTGLDDVVGMAFDWRSIDVDDYVCEWKGLMLRAEQMDRGWWWWAVHNLTKDETDSKTGWESVHDSDAMEHNFPVAETWQDACHFAELYAKHLNQYGTVTLGYLTHTNAGARRGRRRRRGPRFAPFPPKDAQPAST